MQIKYKIDNLTEPFKTMYEFSSFIEHKLTDKVLLIVSLLTVAAYQQHHHTMKYCIISIRKIRVFFWHKWLQVYFFQQCGTAQNGINM